MPAPDSPLDRQYAAFVGPRWATYRRKFAPFFEDARFQPTWNWAAALCTLFGPLWFLYRKLYVPAIAFWMLRRSPSRCSGAASRSRCRTSRPTRISSSSSVASRSPR
jgi:hypothetical protein